MKKKNLFLFLFLFISACSTPPAPPSWERDLKGIKPEYVNNEIDIINIHQILNRTLSWSEN